MSFLTDRFKDLCRRYPGTESLGALRGRHGNYALHIRRPNAAEYYFCAVAKNSGTIVAIRKSLLDRAVAGNRAILMAIVYDFYRFDPIAINDAKLCEDIENSVIVVKFSLEKTGSRLAPPPASTETLSRAGRRIHRALKKEFDVAEVHR